MVAHGARAVGYGNYNRNKVIQEAKQGHPFWFFENGMVYGHSTVGSRNMAGFDFLCFGAEVATAWGFDCTQANPYNDFDGGHKDWNVVFPGVDRPTSTIYWELCREGVDDSCYVATLQNQIDQVPAVVNNAIAPEQIGPNIIDDPSFEAGPQADEFPGLGYSIADRYSKPESKPVGALRVTDEAAHSGRFSLKWDFSKAVGKGFLYDRNRYIIVNVQVPPEAAKKLRGKRVKVGYWFRLGGGSLVPSMNLRQSGKGEHLGGIEYTGGVADPAVWNLFQAEGRLRTDFESLDIHISCRVPEDDANCSRNRSSTLTMSFSKLSKSRLLLLLLPWTNTT